MWLLDGSSVPNSMTIDNFMNQKLVGTIEEIFMEINRYLFTEADVDLNHVYVDGTKILANANKYSWVWKKSSVRNRKKTFDKVTALLEEMNQLIVTHGVKFGVREEYAIEYLEEIKAQFVSLTGFDPQTSVRGRGHRKSTEQRLYDKLSEYTES